MLRTHQHFPLHLQDDPGPTHPSLAQRTPGQKGNPGRLKGDLLLNHRSSQKDSRWEDWLLPIQLIIYLPSAYLPATSHPNPHHKGAIEHTAEKDYVLKLK